MIVRCHRAALTHTADCRDQTSSVPSPDWNITTTVGWWFFLHLSQSCNMFVVQLLSVFVSSRVQWGHRSISDRWIIHNPECVELLLAPNPPCWMTQVMFPGSGVNRMLLSYTTKKTHQKHLKLTGGVLCNTPAPHRHHHIITHPHHTHLSITSSRPLWSSLMKQPARRTLWFQSTVCL